MVKPYFKWARKVLLIPLLTLGMGCWLALPASAEDAPALALTEERLESIKQALLEYALDSAVNVSANAWLGGDGVIKDVVHFSSGLHLHKLRINQYRNRYGYIETSIVEAPTRLSSKFEACDRTSPIKKRIKLESQTQRYSSAQAENLAIQVRDLFFDMFYESERLRASAAIEKHSVLPNQSTDYSRLLVNRPESFPSHSLLLGLDIEEVVGPGVSWSDKKISLGLKGFRVVISVKLVEAGGALIASYNGAVDLVPGGGYKMIDLSIGESSSRGVRFLLGEILQKTTQDLECISSSPVIVTKAGRRLVQAGGHDLGVFEDQEFLILPKTDAFSSLGVARAMQGIGFAVVNSVYNTYADLKALYLEEDSGVKSYVAIPMTDLNFL